MYICIYIYTLYMIHYGVIGIQTNSYICSNACQQRDFSHVVFHARLSLFLSSVIQFHPKHRAMVAMPLAVSVIAAVAACTAWPTAAAASVSGLQSPLGVSEKHNFAALVFFSLTPQNVKKGFWPPLAALDHFQLQN